MHEAILDRAVRGSAGHVCFANVHSLYLASRNPEFRAALESSILVAPDGMPLARALSLVGARQERFEGMSAFPDLLALAAERDVPIAFFGADRATLDAVVARLAIELPRLRVMESIAPAFTELPFPDHDCHVSRLRESDAGIVFVALGCPKQEIWMHRHGHQIPAVLIGVGNALRTWLGYEKRAPVWMRKLSLEWLVRLAQDPARLWRRYLVSNAWFVLVVLPRVLVRRIQRRSSSEQ